MRNGKMIEDGSETLIDKLLFDVFLSVVSYLLDIRDRQSLSVRLAGSFDGPIGKREVDAMLSRLIQDAERYYQDAIVEILERRLENKK